MKLNKHCHCKINPCKCSSSNKTITPVILKKNKDKIDSCKSNISGSELLPVKNKCPTNKISSISRLGNEIIVVMDDCTYYSADINSIDLESFQRNNNPSEEEKDIYVKDISFFGSELKLIRTDEVELKADLSSLNSVDKYVSSGVLLEGTTLRLHFNDNSTIDIDVSELKIDIPTSDSEIISGKTEGHEIILERVKENIIIDATSIILKSVEETSKILNNLSYDIKRKAENYTVTEEDMTGKVMILATGTELTQEITLGRLSEEFIGRAVNITHRMAQNGSILNLIGSGGVSINPPDISPLRRSGSSVVCVYVGEGDWQVFGEIP